MKIALIVAMTSEYEHVKALLADMKEESAGPFACVTGQMKGTQIILMQCGIGKVNAAAGACELIHTFHPDRLVSTGVAGGIDSRLRIMDVVVSRTLAYHDLWCGPGTQRGEVQGVAKQFDGDRDMVRVAMALPCETKVHGGLICTGDQFITDRSQLDEIKSAFPDALAVDMESAAIAHVAHLYGVPFVSFRIISDTPGGEGHQQQWTDFWAQMAEGSFNVTRTFLQQLTL